MVFALEGFRLCDLFFHSQPFDFLLYGLCCQGCASFRCFSKHCVAVLGLVLDTLFLLLLVTLLLFASGLDLFEQRLLHLARLDLLLQSLDVIELLFEV